MTVHDRLRATTEAVSGTMREVRPLTLPPQRPGRAAPPPERRRRSGWLVPIAAAAAVIAVAATLVAVRDVHTAAPSSPAPIANSSVDASSAIPSYYVELGAFTMGAAGHPDAIVADDRTGKAVATVKAPAGLVFDGVAGTTDDRTFVLDAVSATTVFASNTPPAGRHTWFLLRIAPGSSDPATLTRLPVTAVLDSDQIDGLALAPDASTLAVLYRTDVALGSAGPFRMQTFSLSTGRALRTWTAPANGEPSAVSTPPEDGGGLTWTPNGKTLAFMWWGPTWHSYLRTLNVARKSGSLLAASRTIFSNQGNQDDCNTVLLASSGRTLFCGTVGNALAGCRAQEPQFKLYSAVTGRLARILYTYPGNCQNAVISPLWAGAEDTMIGLLQITDDTKSGPGRNTFTVGVFSPGKFTPLRMPESLSNAPSLGDLAF
jgi:hypothetical protein